MKLAERIALLKAGYSKDEIDALIKEDAEAVNDIKPDDASGTDQYMEVIKALANEVKDLKTAVHASNIESAEATKPVEKSASDILAEIFGEPQKENLNGSK